MRQRRSGPTGLSRRDFLKVGGAGLAGAALFGITGCGGGEQSGGATELYFTAPPDLTGTTSKLISQFNKKNKGEYKVIFREGNTDTGERLNKLRT
jgi:multiple sugar transport system substrate-binding protein